VRDEVREGFASLRAHIAPQRAAAAFSSAGWSNRNATWTG
jgi:hypothetical protein